jgi:sigma-B regulation protein RsbU (phosphoserine phosphatase)
MNILIVDDDLTSLLVLEATLKKLGHQVTTAKSGLEALPIFEKGSVSLMISDMVMPDVDGLELCRRIRTAGRAQYTYIIMLTAVGGKSGYLVGMKAGADDFIVKPFDEELLAARLVVAERILNLQSQVSQLSGLLPICALCKKVRDDQNYWEQVESYVAKRTDARFTHSYCPDCFDKLRSEISAQPSIEGPSN